MNLSELITSYREEHNLSQRQFADICGLSNGYISMLEKNENPKTKQPITPTLPKLDKLAKGMNISINELFDIVDDIYVSLEDSLSYPSSTIVDNYVTFPVIGEIAAGYDSIALEDWEGDTVDIPLSYLQGRNSSEFFVLKVKGDSMFPTYQEGDKVLILKASTMEYSGQVGAVLYDDEYASLKKIEFIHGEDWMRLVAINPNVPIKTIESEALDHCKIIGIARKLIRDIY